MLGDYIVSFLNQILVNEKVFFWMGYSQIFYTAILLSIIDPMGFSNLWVLLLKLGL